MSVFEANPKIVEFMRERGVLLFTENYEHRYPHCWRCKNPVIFRATPQWFISMDAGAETDSESFSLRNGAQREIQEKVNWIPAWGRERMLNMFKDRGDWCVSRQRVWGVPIPAFYCASCCHEDSGSYLLDPGVIKHVADIFESESSDAWYKREASELLPAGFKCPKCGGAEFTKETDILDVWFDSGSSWIAFSKTTSRTNCKHGDRLMSTSKVAINFAAGSTRRLLVSLAKYRQRSLSQRGHARLVDHAQGKKMSKSQGTGISPNEVIKESGADILRLWCASSDYHEDMRCSEEILARVRWTLIVSFAIPRVMRSAIFMASIRRAIAFPSRRCWRLIVGRWRNLMK